ncbi:ABHD3 [Symbiodinium microadriaticum]|nr:ABHD3 [Symbiodinium microadriaticum]
MRMIQSLMAQFREEGFQVVALNQRCETAEETGHKITAPKVTCLDNFRDLMEITQHILARHPQVELSAVGFSMGGTQLLRHLGSQGAKTPFRSAVAIAPHLDVPSWARSLSSSRGKRILSYLMSQLCKQYIKATLEGTKAMDLVDSASLKSAGSLQEVEQAVVCPLHGYAAVDEYYAAVSPHAFLGQIAVPTLILHTEDDPWVPFDSSIIKQLQNPLLFAAASQRGGHLGWRSTDAGKGTWADSMAAQFIKAAASQW